MDVSNLLIVGVLLLTANVAFAQDTTPPQVFNCPTEDVRGPAATTTGGTNIVGWNSVSAFNLGTAGSGTSLTFSMRNLYGQAQNTEFSYGFTTVGYEFIDNPDPPGPANTALCTFFVAIPVLRYDPAPQTVICPGDQIITVGSSRTQGSASWIEPVPWVDNNIIFRRSWRSHAPNTFFPLGITEVTYRWIVLSNSTTPIVCMFTVTVSTSETDNTVPSLTCPKDFTTTSANPTWMVPTATDPSGVLPVEGSHNSGGALPVGFTTVTYTATDNTGNRASCSFLISRSPDNDQHNPVITSCPRNIQLTAVSATSLPTIIWATPTAYDGSGHVRLVMNTHSSGSTFPIGTTSVQYLFQDIVGLVAQCVFNVIIFRPALRCWLPTVEPTPLVIIGCPAPINVNLPQGNSDVIVTWVEPSNSETIGVSQTETHQPGSRFTDGVTTVKYIFTNQAGISAVCTFNVTVSVLPMLSQPPMVTVEPTSATVKWQAWNDAMDTGDGPIIAYIVYFTSMGDSNWVSAGNITDTTQDSYSFLVENLEPSTDYSFSVAAVRDGQGGEGPRSPLARMETLPPTIVSTQGITPLDDLDLATVETPSAGSSVIIPIICVVVVVVVVILVMRCLVYFLRVRKGKHQQPKPQESTRDQEMTGYENEVAPDHEINTPSAIDFEQVGQNQASAYEPVRDDHSSPTYEYIGLPTWAEPWNVLWDNFMVGTKVLREGQFGDVLYGGVIIEGELCKAAIKKLQEHAPPADRKIFLDDFRSMTTIGHHTNIVRILGACQHEGELYVATEYLPNGDLRSYLRKARLMESEESLSPDKLLQFALDVAKGMQHLAMSGVIHRDLAARNILLDENLVAKISDYGLSRGEDIYVQMSKTRVPVRWLSLESMTSKTYTTKSDVWSYGILLWEIATVGGTPYPGIQNGVLASMLKNGYRMPKPTNCDIKIYDLMTKCWQEKPNNRPPFEKIVSVLTTMTANQNDQIYMSLLPRSEEYDYITPEFDEN